MQGSPVTLNVYDLSGGLAASMSRALVGTQIDGIWYVSRQLMDLLCLFEPILPRLLIPDLIFCSTFRHTGIVAFGTEWYWSGILQAGVPVRKHLHPSLQNHILTLCFVTRTFVLSYLGSNSIWCPSSHSSVRTMVLLMLSTLDLGCSTFMHARNKPNKVFAFS